MMASDEEVKAHAVALVMMGLPASGKTSTCAELVRLAGAVDGDIDIAIDVQVVSFDDLFEMARPSAPDSVAAWHASRRNALDALTRALQRERIPGRRRVVVVDDTMVLRSMRRRVHRIAADAGAAYACAYVRVPFEAAAARVWAHLRAAPEAWWTPAARLGPNEDDIRARREAGSAANAASELHAMDLRTRRRMTTALKAARNRTEAAAELAAARRAMLGAARGAGVDTERRSELEEEFYARLEADIQRTSTKGTSGAHERSYTNNDG